MSVLRIVVATSTRIVRVLKFMHELTELQSV